MVAKIFGIRIGIGGSKADSALKLIRLDERLTKRIQSVRDATKTKRKSQPKTLYVIDFRPSISAKEVERLREEIDVISEAAQPGDEALVRINSPGGYVSGYGHAASQLLRLRERVFVTVAVDEVAASGGYMCAVVANKIIAAPFATIGSIGVVAEGPNFASLMEKLGIQWMELTAGNQKRSISMFQPVTEERAAIERARLLEMHELFKSHVLSYRSGLDIDNVATGNYWVASKAITLGLVDELKTSDQYIIEKSKEGISVLSVNIAEASKGLWKTVFGGR